MRLKSYFAATVEAAISLASRELGEDAMLVYSRETLPEARNLGHYEVVFALESEAPTAGAVAEPARIAQTTEKQPEARATEGEPWREVRADLHEMKRHVARLERLIEQTAGALAHHRWGVGGEEIYRELCSQDLPAGLAAEVVAAVEAKLGKGAAWDREAVLAELAALLAALPCGRGAMEGGQAHVFVGPPGAGKTTMLVKIAVLLAVERRLPAMLVSLDSRRIGGADQLKTFAHILGVPFCAVDHRAALERLIETESRRLRLFVDTPGFSDEDLTEQEWLYDALSRNSEVRAHLVVPSYLRTRECARIIKRFEAFRPATLMLTHADECESMGGVAGEAIRCGLPISYCGTGQSIPEDVQAGEPEWLARRILSAADGLPAAGAERGVNWAVA